jgi:hypothetical protein
MEHRFSLTALRAGLATGRMMIRILQKTPDFPASSQDGKRIG